DANHAIQTVRTTQGCPFGQGVLAMSIDNRNYSAPTEWSLSLPATLMGVALLVALVAALLAHVAKDFLVPFRVLLLVCALITAGLAVWWRLGSLEDNFYARIWAATLVADSAVVIYSCREAMSEDWDSLRMAFLAFTIVALVGSVVVLLP